MRKLTIWGLLLFCSAFVYAQEAMVLDDAILDSVNFFSSKLKAGSTIAVTNVEAETKELSDFIIQELLVAFGNTGSVKVVERNRLESLQAELDFGMSLAVSDETAQRIGHITGAQILFSGSIVPYRDMYRLRVQAIVVETSEIIGPRTINVKYDPTLTGLLGKINPADAWKYQWLYAGFNVGYTLQLKRDDSRDYYVDIPLGFSIYARVQPFDLFGIALDFSGDLFDGPNISVVPTITIRPFSFEINLFLGVGINTFYKGIAFTGGGRAGYKLGPGVLYAEVRPIGVLIDEYIPINVNFSLGYQIGFIPRKK
jgi:hypothetical protein